MFYIGFRDNDHAQIGIARSRDGIRLGATEANPIIGPTGTVGRRRLLQAVCPFDGQQWLLWYNGRHGGAEQIGLATHQGEDLGFAAQP